MIRALLSIVCSTLCLAAGAATNYVDCAYMASSDEDYAAHDGTSWAKAFRTIQEGVDACGDGDTVLVAEGRYDAGGKASADDGWNRVYLATKGITLKSVAGAAKTFIVGARDAKIAVDANGNGPNAVRCIFSTAADSVVEGFTLTDGAAHPTFDKENALRADGGGTLFGTVGTQPVSVTDESVSLEYSGMATPRPLEFSFSGSGYGELFGFYQNLLGLTVIIR